MNEHWFEINEKKVIYEPSCGCWLWGGYLQRDGYGQTYVDGKSRLAHRIFYEFFKGEIPRGLQLDHLCRNRSCVNPDHLEPVTSHENSIRGAKAITHCPKGHLYDEENTRIIKSKRFCKECDRISSRMYKARKREARQNGAAA